jgi:GNAT superfamily N-acetyltransferase
MTPPPKGVRVHLMQMKEIAQADTIRDLAGWNQTEADWRRLLALAPGGCFVAAAAGVPVGTVTTTVYGKALAWIGMMLVHPEQRRRGIGGALLGQAMGHLQEAGVTCIGLDATPAGRPLYAGVGFTPVWDLARWQGRLPESLSRSGPKIVSTIPDRHWPALVELDRQSFGVARPSLLRALAEQSVRVALALDGANGVAGFGMLRRGSRGWMLGPVVTPDKECAAQLLAALCADLPPEPLFWDIPEPNPAALQLAESLGFARQRTLTRMAWGTAYPSHNPQLLYAVADLAAG